MSRLFCYSSQGYVRHDQGGGGQHGQYGQQQGMMGQQVSIFTVFNQKLLDAGIPRFNLGSTIGDIEPIVTVGFLLAMLLFGLPGLLFGAILFAVCKVSMGGGQGQQGQGQHGQGQGQGHYHPPGGRRWIELLYCTCRHVVTSSWLSCLTGIWSWTEHLF